MKWFFKSLLAIPVLLLLAFAATELNKAYWDYKVKQWCEKDGGVTVYERVELSKQEYKVLDIPFERESSGSMYFYRITDSVIKSRYPNVRKGDQFLVRSSDKKILGKSRYYGRGGGDLVEFSHASSFGCTSLKGINFDLTGSVFLLKEKSNVKEETSHIVYDLGLD